MSVIQVGEIWMLNPGRYEDNKPALVTGLFETRRTVRGKGWSQGCDTRAHLECPVTGEKFGSYRIEYLIELVEAIQSP
ncbi:MAG: hypothetical protein OSB10_04370 [Planctomycetota bacterium]|nr:hypothetical protein [Planctomycetota bacterium]